MDRVLLFVRTHGWVGSPIGRVLGSYDPWGPMVNPKCNTQNECLSHQILASEK